MFKLNQVLYTTGFNRQCKCIIIKVKFIEYLPEVKKYTKHDGSSLTQDCIVECKGLNINSDSSKLYANRSEVNK